MCEKQCRDENGFKCHLTSESHRRQMDIFGQNPSRVIEGYSQEFESMFLEHLRRTHPFSRVSANVVYNEFIADRNHIHMNATKWVTLTAFVKYLGREGKCKVEDTEKGWFITLIHKDPEAEMEEKRRKRKENAEKEEEERHARMLAAQIEKAKAAAPRESAEERPSHELDRRKLDGPLGFSMNIQTRTLDQQGPTSGFVQTPTFNFENDEALQHVQHPPPSKRSKLEELIKRDMKSKAVNASRDHPHDHWLMPNIIVKIMSPALKAHGYYKQKGSIVQVIEGRVGEIEMLESGDIIRVDETELETVIPKPGGRVLIVRGRYKGKEAELLEIDTDKFMARIRLGHQEHWVEYEDISRTAKT